MKSFLDKSRLDRIFEQKLGQFDLEPHDTIWDHIEENISAPIKMGSLGKAGWLVPLVAIASVSLALTLLNADTIEGWVADANDVPHQMDVVGPIGNEEEVTITPLKASLTTPSQKTIDEPILLETQLMTPLDKIQKPLRSQNLVSAFSDEVLLDALTIDHRSDNNEFSGARLPIMTIDKIETSYSQSSKEVNLKKAKLKEPDRNAPAYKMKGLHIGPLVRLNNTWIVNQNTYDEFNGYELAYKFDFGTAFGVRIGYDFNTKFGMQVEWIFNSNQGQKYVDIIYRELVRREVDLKYVKFPLLLKYKFSKISPVTSRLVVRNIILGVEYGRLQEAYITIQGNKVSSIDKFDTNEFGVIFGMDYDMYLSDHFFLTLGGRGSFGSDINGIKWRVKDDYRKSNNFLLGINAGISYLIK